VPPMRRALLAALLAIVPVGTIAPPMTAAARTPALPTCAAIARLGVAKVGGTWTRSGSIVTERSGDSQWAATLLDTLRRLPASYVPSDLVALSATAVPTARGPQRLRAAAATALARLFAAAAADGVKLAIHSSYRSYAYQRTVFAGWVAKDGLAAALRYSALAGHSEHQLGTTLDIARLRGGAPWDDRGYAPVERWLGANAYRFGFVRSYPAGAGAVAQSCYGSEPWHWRYVGPSSAYEIACTGLVPRVYLWRVQQGIALAKGPSCGGLVVPDGYAGPLR